MRAGSQLGSEPIRPIEFPDLAKCAADGEPQPSADAQFQPYAVSNADGRPAG